MSETKKIKAYILSQENGTIQIGDTTYQPATGAIFGVTAKGTKNLPFVLVSEKSMKGAEEAILKWSPNQ